MAVGDAPGFGERRADVAYVEAAGADAEKKSLRAAEQDRPDVAAARAAWRESQPTLDPARLIFIDETWTKTNMTRHYGWAKVGHRLVDAVPHGHVWTPAPKQGESTEQVLRVTGCGHVSGL